MSELLWLKIGITLGCIAIAIAFCFVYSEDDDSVPGWGWFSDRNDVFRGVTRRPDSAVGKPTPISFCCWTFGLIVFFWVAL